MAPAEDYITVPNVSGLSAREAIAVLSEAGFYPKRKRKLKDIPGAPVVENGQAIATNPPAGSQIHIVEAGETLSAISRKYGVSVAKNQRIE